MISFFTELTNSSSLSTASMTKLRNKLNLPNLPNIQNTMESIKMHAFKPSKTVLSIELIDSFLCSLILCDILHFLRDLSIFGNFGIINKFGIHCDQ